MDLYKILGIKKGASDKEVKEAFRKRAQKVHPDRKGGNEEEMARLNLAYQTLSDPEKKERYDTTGSVIPPTPIRHEAIQILVKIMDDITEAMQEGDLIKKTWEIVTSNMVVLTQTKGVLVKKLAYIKKVKTKIELKNKKAGKDNIYMVFFDNKIEKLEKALKDAERAEKIAAVVLEILDEYIYTGEMPPEFAQITFVSNGIRYVNVT